MDTTARPSSKESDTCVSERPWSIQTSATTTTHRSTRTACNWRSLFFNTVHNFSILVAPTRDEASAAEVTHINVDTAAKLTHWRLPNSKADWKALGATRTHACSCSETLAPELRPFHCMVKQIQWTESIKSLRLFPSTDRKETAKQGWADTFEAIAKKLKLQVHSPTGLR